jgi:glutaconate CoA-transferase subunit B
MQIRYTNDEFIPLVAARRIRNGDIIFCGTGPPLLAAIVAKKITAPKAIIFFETGAIDPSLSEIPLAASDPRTVQGACTIETLVGSLSMLQNKKWGAKITAIIGGAQIDPWGNINSTCIGNYHSPKVRLTGSGGAGDAGALVGRLMIIMRLKKGRFVKMLDYITTPGWLGSGRKRGREGLRPGGIDIVITNKCTMKFHPRTRRIYINTIYPGVRIEEIKENIEFNIDFKFAKMEKEPSQIELNTLRKEIDSQKLALF